MLKTNVLDSPNSIEYLNPSNNNSSSANDNCESNSNIVSLSQYRERIKRISTDKNPLPPCAFAMAA